MQKVLPRHREIIRHINHELLEQASAHRPGDLDFLASLSLIDERGERRVRMANLSVVGSHKVNGVTPRRWLAQANPGLAGLLDQAIGPRWRLELDQLRGLTDHASRASFRA